MKKGKIAVIAVILVLLAAAAYFVLAGSNGGVAVKVFKAKRENIISSVSATGIVQEKGRSNIYVNTPVRIKKIDVKNGDRVRKGDILASLDVEGLRIQYEQARISYNIDKINLENLMKNQSVKDTINEESAVSSARFSLEHKQLVYDEAKREYDENLKLYDTGAVSRRDLDKYGKRLNEAEVELNGAAVMLENAKKSLNSAEKDNLNYQRNIMAQIDMQSEKLLISELKIKEMIENLKDVDIETGKVIAPSDGMIASIGIKEGDYTVAGQVAICIVDIDELAVNAKITESNIKKVKLGNKVVITSFLFLMLRKIY